MLDSAISLSTVGERLGDEPGELLGDPLSDSDAGEISGTERTSTGKLARRRAFTRGIAECFNDKLSPRKLGDAPGELLGDPLTDSNVAELSDPFSLEPNPAV